MSVYQQGELWYTDFQWKDPRSGKQRRIRRACKDEKQRPAKSQTAAEAFENRVRAQLAAGTFEVEHAPADVLTLEGFRERYFREHVGKLKSSSQAAQETIWRVSLLPVLADAQLREIGDTHYAKVATRMRKNGASPKTVNNALSALRTALTLANEWGLRGPPSRVRWEKVPEPVIEWFEQEQIDQLVAAADPMVTFALKTGLRLGELLALRWGDIKGNAVAVSRSVWWAKGKAHEGATKSGRIRTIPLPASAVAALEALGRGKPTAWVFPDAHGGQLAKGETKWPLWRACEAAGLAKCGWHKLRHSYVSSLVRGGVPLPQVQKLAGHARIEMTMRYTHVGDEDLQRAVAVLA